MATENNTFHFWIGLLVHHVTASSKYEWIVWNWKSYLQLAMAVIGIVGNSLVICVYIRKLHFHIAKNTLILNLAVADLLTSVFIIPLPKLTHIGHTAFGEFYCSFAWSGVTLWICIVGSVYTLTMLSVERYLAVVYPIKYRMLFVGARPKVVIAAVWILSTLVNVYIAFIANNKESRCIIVWPWVKFQAIFGVFLFLAEFFIPMVIMLVAHTRTIYSLRMQAANLRQSRGQSRSARNSPSIALLRTRRKVIETLFLVVIIFIVCWLPDQMAYMLYNLGVLEDAYLSTHLYDFFVLLAFVNSCVNPIIYTFKNKEFRHSLKVLLCVRKKNQIHPTNENHIAVVGLTTQK